LREAFAECLDHKADIAKAEIAMPNMTMPNMTMAELSPGHASSPE